ncbi:transposase [Paraburkholderia sp. BR14263]|uniref:Transposase n=1 Tax=Paraburkholderia ferrariae TaxID=386056 RepID=A0ABU9RKM9_9BURK
MRRHARSRLRRPRLQGCRHRRREDLPPGITRGLRAMIRRRSAIEPAIGHMKTDGKLDRNRLKGALGDAMHAVLCGAGHNLRMIRNLRLLCALILAALFNCFIAADFPA